MLYLCAVLHARLRMDLSSFGFNLFLRDLVVSPNCRCVEKQIITYCYHLKYTLVWDIICYLLFSVRPDQLVTNLLRFKRAS